MGRKITRLEDKYNHSILVTDDTYRDLNHPEFEFADCDYDTLLQIRDGGGKNCCAAMFLREGKIQRAHIHDYQMDYFPFSADVVGFTSYLLLHTGTTLPLFRESFGKMQETYRFRIREFMDFLNDQDNFNLLEKGLKKINNKITDKEVSTRLGVSLGCLKQPKTFLNQLFLN